MKIIRTWSGVSTTPLREQTLAVQFDGKDLARLDLSGGLDVLFPLPLRTALVHAGLAKTPAAPIDADWVSVAFGEPAREASRSASYGRDDPHPAFAPSAEISSDAPTDGPGDVSIRRATFVLRLAYLYRVIVRSRTEADHDRVRTELDALHVDGPVRDAFDALLNRPL